MVYKIKGNLHRDFSVMADNVLDGRAYFIPFVDENLFNDSDIRNERYTSDAVRVLSGDWDFRYYSDETDIPRELDTESVEFDTVSVPSVWQFTGYEEPYYVNSRYQFPPKPPEIPEHCSAALYRKTFDVLAEDAERDYILTFLGVAGAIEVYFNGEYVGYSECSHNTAEYSLTGKVKEGTNEILVLNHKWSNATYLECQDMFRCNGIFRDVLLTSAQGPTLWDMNVKTEFNPDGTYDMTVSCDVTEDCTVLAKIADDKIIIAESESDTKDKKCSFEFKNLSVKEWSAEIPFLYTLTLGISDGKQIYQYIKRPVGFKHIKINGNVFTFNNKAIKLLGVNHHDTSAHNGYAMTPYEMERDVRIFKEYNVNCVRTSHYPPDPLFLDLCDEYGIYVVDEADIETHGCEVEMHKPGIVSDNHIWQSRYLDRVMRMYQRDKNHPSITMWSLGNEAHGYLNQDACYAELKKYTDIPVHYEGVCRTKRWAYDVISQMYPWFQVVSKISDGRGLSNKFYSKPYFMCEYAHAMGLGAGELDTYVDYFLKASNMMGGCIWEFCDHAVYHEDGEYRYTYGGDHCEEKHDSNFCVDGLFDPERNPHAGAIAMRNCYRSVRAAHDGGNSFLFKNINLFAPVEYVVKWVAFSDAEEIATGEELLKLAPGEKKTVTLDYTATESGSLDVVFRYYDNDGTERGAEQLTLSASEKIYSIKCDHAPVVTKNEKKLVISFDGGKMIYNTKTGFFESYEKDGRQYLNPAPFGSAPGFCPTIFRAPIDNDMNFKRVWESSALSTEYPVCTTKKKGAYTVEDNKVVFENFYRLDTVKKKGVAKLKITVSIYGDGTVKVAYEVLCSFIFPYVPRFGLAVEMPAEYNNVTYFGRGDRANTSDFKAHAMLGEYSMTVDEMHENYIMPQESSMRTDVYHAKVVDDEGRGLEFIAAAEPFIFGADHYTSQMCAKASHIEALHRCDTTVVHLDAYMLGAGSNACGPIPTSAHRLHRIKGQKQTIVIKPV